MKAYERLKHFIPNQKLIIFTATAVFYSSFMSLLYYNYHTESNSKYLIVATGLLYFVSFFITASRSASLKEHK